MSNFTSIDPTSLDSVTGGKTVKPNTSVGGSTSSSGSSDALLNQLTGLQSSIKDLASAKPQSAFGGTNTMLLFAVLAMNRPQQSNVVVVRRGFW
ncbi:MAG: hypothetical protein IPQ07_14145 [Myxococcales bacterium]|nr:hypothetical protein [Myxococcales bacterium]